jgi:hypothetical protein
MGKRVYIAGKSVRVSELSPNQIEKERVLRLEKMLMAQFYREMSTTGLWSRDKEDYMAKFDQMSAQIKEIQEAENAEWFAGLSEK